MIGDITNHLWQSTLFALAAALAAAALRENRAHVRYWVWFAASVKFFVPFSLLVSAGSGWRWTLTATEFGAPAVQAVSLALVHMTQPFPHSAATAETHSNQGTGILFAVWVCGFSWIAGRRWKEWRRIRAAIRSSGPATFRTGMETGARVLSGPGLREPAVAGLRRPVLLLPAGLEDCLTPAQLEAVLTHELCHVRRKDNITAAIHMAAEAVFWFHPLIWWIGARLLAERERACDEHVLQALKTTAGVRRCNCERVQAVHGVTACLRARSEWGRYQKTSGGHSERSSGGETKFREESRAGFERGLRNGDADGDGGNEQAAGGSVHQAR